LTFAFEKVILALRAELYCLWLESFWIHSAELKPRAIRRRYQFDEIYRNVPGLLIEDKLVDMFLSRLLRLAVGHLI
jgi:hypothetical protein